jgi:hypothetical protein
VTVLSSCPVQQLFLVPMFIMCRYNGVPPVVRTNLFSRFESPKQYSNKCFQHDVLMVVGIRIMEKDRMMRRLPHLVSFGIGIVIVIVVRFSVQDDEKAS